MGVGEDDRRWTIEFVGIVERGPCGNNARVIGPPVVCVPGDPLDVVPASVVVGLRGEVERLRTALEAIVRHQDMPDGESWEQAYGEVCEFARDALDAVPVVSLEQEDNR